MERAMLTMVAAFLFQAHKKRDPQLRATTMQRSVNLALAFAF